MNQMKSANSYSAHKATRRRTEARKFAAAAEVFGSGSDIDGKRAIIDLAVAGGYRLNQRLVEMLEAAGYEVPEAARPHKPAAEDNDEAGNAPTPPASGSLESETNPPHSTTDGDTGQVVLIIRYVGKPPLPAKTFATGELLDYQDGNGSKPPAHNIADIRLWLKTNGYGPDWSAWAWLDRGAGNIRRREVYRLREGAQPTEIVSHAELTALGKAAGTVPEPVTEEMKQRWIEQANQRTGWHDPTRLDPFYRQNWNNGRGWRMGASGVKA